MKDFAILLLAAFLSGCVTNSEAAFRYCGEGSPGKWHPISAGPVDAEKMEALAVSSPNSLAGKLDLYPITQWFTNDNGEFMLCRIDERSCSGQWWQFRKTDDGPAISRQSAWICVTRARSNNSFKPKPLRGSA